MATLQLYVVRHGETYFNQFQVFQGWSDTPLTPRGNIQLAQTAQILAPLEFQHIYTSDAGRAIASAAKIQATNHWDVPCTALPELREHFYGAFEGHAVAHTWHLIALAHGLQDFPELVAHTSVDATQDYLQDSDPTGLAETSATFWHRFIIGLTMIVRDNPGEGPVLLISHSANIRALVARYAPELLVPLNPENGKITKLSLQLIPALRIHVDYYNQLVHD